MSFLTELKAMDDPMHHLKLSDHTLRSQGTECRCLKRVLPASKGITAEINV